MTTITELVSLAFNIFSVGEVKERAVTQLGPNGGSCCMIYIGKNDNPAKGRKQLSNPKTNESLHRDFRASCNHKSSAALYNTRRKERERETALGFFYIIFI